MQLCDLPAVLTVGQAASFLRISHRAVIDAVHTGELPAMQLAPQILIDTRQLLEELGVRLVDRIEEVAG